MNKFTLLFCRQHFICW